MGRAFSIAELLIVAAIIGILAALVTPLLHSHAMDAKQAAIHENLQLLRGAVELYAARHRGVAPGYADNDPSGEPTAERFVSQTTIEDRCLLQIPDNPFNNSNRIRIIGNEEPFPTEATGQDGWIYQPATKVIRVDWPGSDEKGVRYFDY